MTQQLFKKLFTIYIYVLLFKIVSFKCNSLLTAFYPLFKHKIQAIFWNHFVFTACTTSRFISDFYLFSSFTSLYQPEVSWSYNWAVWWVRNCFNFFPIQKLQTEWYGGMHYCDATKVLSNFFPGLSVLSESIIFITSCIREHLQLFL